MAKVKQYKTEAWNKYSVEFEMYDKDGDFIDCWNSTEVVAQDVLSAVNRAVRAAANGGDETFAAYALTKVERTDEYVLVAV